MLAYPTGHVLANAFGDSVVLEADSLSIYQLRSFGLMHGRGSGARRLRAGGDSIHTAWPIDTTIGSETMIEPDSGWLTPAKRVLFFSIHSARHVGVLVRPAVDGALSRGSTDSILAHYARLGGELERLPSDRRAEYAWKYPPDWYRRADVEGPKDGHDLFEIIWIAAGPDDVPPPMGPISGGLTLKRLRELTERHARSHPGTGNGPARIIGRALVDPASKRVIAAEGETQ